MVEYQVTVKCSDGKYKPVSCIVKSKEVDLSNKREKQCLIEKGIQKICAKRYWTNQDLRRYNYTKVLVRLYDKEKLAQEAAARYEAIKEAKYESGEWKRPKKKD